MNNTWSRRRALSWLVAFALVAAAGSMACSPGSGTAAPPVIKLAFVTNNASEFWKIAAAGVRKYEAEGQACRSTSRCRRTARRRSRTRSSRTWRVRVTRPSRSAPIAPNDQVPVLNQCRGKDDAHHVRFRCARSRTVSCTSAPTTTKPARCWAARSSSCSLRRQHGRVRRHVLGRQRRPAVQRHPGRHRRPQHRPIVDQARGRHRSRQGALERRGHHQRPSRSQPGGGPVVVQRARRSPRRSRRSARRGRCWRPCSTRRTGTLEAIADGTMPSPSCRSRSSSAISRASGCTSLRPRARRRVPRFPPASDRHGRRGDHQGERGASSRSSSPRSRSSRARSRISSPTASPAARDAGHHQDVSRRDRAGRRVAARCARARCWR